MIIIFKNWFHSDALNSRLRFASFDLEVVSCLIRHFVMYCFISSVLIWNLLFFKSWWFKIIISNRFQFDEQNSRLRFVRQIFPIFRCDIRRRSKEQSGNQSSRPMALDGQSRTLRWKKRRTIVDRKKRKHRKKCFEW